MAGLVVQHNMNAINANNKLNMNVVGTKKATEKLSSGLRINRAGDDAAGLAISEKMRAQTRGLKQATNNANDGISLIQTAEGGLNETHSILQRMRELAVQSANGTYQNDVDREAMQLEVDALKSEVDRISQSTEYNGVKLLDGSLGGTSNKSDNFGALYGFRSSKGDTTAEALGGTAYTVTSNISGATIKFTSNASGSTTNGDAGENAVWNTTGNEVTINLVAGNNYTDEQINNLIKNATKPDNMTGAPADISFKTDTGKITGPATTASPVSTGATASGSRQTINADISSLVGTGAGGSINSSDQISFTANSYGSDGTTAGVARSITILTDADPNKESVSIENARVAGASGEDLKLHLASGKTYSEKDIHDILARAGFDYEIKLGKSNNPNGSTNGQVTFNTGKGASGVVADGSSNITDPVEVPLKQLYIKQADDTYALFDGTNFDDSSDDKLYVDLPGPGQYIEYGSTPDQPKLYFKDSVNNDVKEFNATNLTNYKLSTTQELYLDDQGTEDYVAGDNIEVPRQLAVNAAQGGSGVGRTQAAGGQGLVFQIGANGVADQRVALSVNNMGSSALGISGANVATQDDANKSIEKIDNAINSVSMQRAGLGALQNRLEYTVNNLTTTNENLTAAESQIRDTDMASEMLNYTKYNILQQAAQAMLAQANQAPQSVLQLLQ